MKSEHPVVTPVAGMSANTASRDMSFLTGWIARLPGFMRGNTGAGRSEYKLGITLALLAALGFSMKAVFVKLAYETAKVDAITLLTLRMGLALPIFLLMSRGAFSSLRQLSRADQLRILFLGMIGYYGSSLLDFMGLAYISAGLERLILFTYPSITVLLGILFMGKKLEKRILLALLLSYAGIALGFLHDASVTADKIALLTGSGLVFGCAVFYAIYSAASESVIRKLGAARFTALALTVTSFTTFLHFLIARPLSALQLPWQVYGYSGAMAVFSTVLPIFWQASAVRYIGAERAVLVATLGPMLTILLSWAFLGEPVSLAQLAGTVLVVGGVMLVGKAKR